MEETIEVLAPGTTVALDFRNPEGAIKGEIIGIRIRRHDVYYEVQWWNGCARMLEYFAADNFQVVEPVTRKIGFRNE